MSSPLPKYLSQMSAGAAIAVLACSIAAAQPQSSSSSSAPEDVQSTPSAFWTGDDPNTRITVMEDTLIRVMTNTPLHAGTTREGSPVLFTLSQDVVVDHVLIVPRGATVHGTVVRSRKAGKLKRAADLTLKLVSLDLAGRSYPLYTYHFQVEGESKENPTRDIVGGAEIGALAGEVAGARTRANPTRAQALADMGTGAAAGAGVVALASVVTPGPKISLPPESQMDFYLASPIAVVPVNATEAARLSHVLPRGGPVLYVRGETP